MLKKKLATIIALALTIMMPTQFVVSATNNNSSVIEDVENEDGEDAKDEQKREEVTLVQIEDSKDLENLKVVVGTKNKEVREMLPETVMAEVEDGRVLEFEVKWDISSYKQNQVGEYPATGELTSKEYKITNSKDVLAELTIFSNEEKEEVLEIESIEKFDDINVYVGTSEEEVMAKLPTEVKASLNDGQDVLLDVEWDTSVYDANVAGTYEIKGALSSDMDIANIGDFTATINVVSEEESLEGLRIEITPIEGREELRVEIAFGYENIEDEATIVIEDANGNLVFIDQVASSNDIVKFNTVLPKGEYKGFVNALDMYDWDNLGGKVELEFTVE